MKCKHVEGDEIIPFLDSHCPCAKYIIGKNEDRLGSNGSCSNYSIEVLEDGGLEISHVTWGKTKAIFRGNHIYCKAGSVYSETDQGLNQFLNIRVPNVVYHIDENMIIKSDCFGRLQSSAAFLSKSYLIDRSRRDDDAQERAKSEQDGLGGDEAGHSIPHCFGGPNEFVNLVPMSTAVNQRILKNLEAMEKAAIDLELSIYSRRDYVYQGYCKRPTQIIAYFTTMGSEIVSKEVPQILTGSIIVDNKGH